MVVENGHVLNAAVRWNRRWADRLRARFPAACSSPPYVQELLSRIGAEIDARRPARILEIGGIDRPLLGKGRGFIYDGLYIESREGCYRAYDNFLVQSVEERIPGQYDV